MNSEMNAKKLKRAVMRVDAVTVSGMIMLAVIVMQVVIEMIFEGIAGAVFNQSIYENAMLADVKRIVYGAVTAVAAVALYNKKTGPGKKTSCANTENTPGRGEITVRYIYILFFGIAMQGLAYCMLNIAYAYAAGGALFADYSNMISNLDGSNSALVFLYTMLLAPLAEEYIFRGLIYSYALCGFKAAGANILQAFLFGLYHGNIIQGLYAFVLGLLLGYMACRKRNMAEVVFLHMAVNFSGIFIVPRLMGMTGSVVGRIPAYISGTLVSIAVLAVFISVGEDSHLLGGE